MLSDTRTISFCLPTAAAALIAALLVPSVAAAQQEAGPQKANQHESAQHEVAQQAPDWTVTVDGLTFALGFAHVQVERALGDSVSVYAGPHLRLFNGLLSEPGDDYMGLGAEVGVRYFFGANAPSGAWMMARAVGAHITADVDGAQLAKLGGYASALGGYTWILGQRWVLAAGGGIQYIDYDIGGMGTSGLAPALHTNLGVAF